MNDEDAANPDKKPLSRAEWKARAEAAEAERDAYRKAKQENDERFQLEAMHQRARAEAAEADLALAHAEQDAMQGQLDAAERKVVRVEMLRDNWLELGTKSTVYESAGELAEILTAALTDEETTDG